MPNAARYGCEVGDRESEVNENEDRRIVRLKEEAQRLKFALDSVCSFNNELKAAVNALCENPSQKRLLFAQLCQKHGISKRKACDLLGLARSTCWYKPCSTKTLWFRKYLPRTPISPTERFRVLRQIVFDLENSHGIADDSTLRFIEVSLAQLGLETASSLVRTDLGLALEMFEDYWSDDEGGIVLR